jgi:hypothetical protein
LFISEFPLQLTSMPENVDGLVASCCVIHMSVSVGTACSNVTMKQAVRPSKLSIKMQQLVKDDLHDGQFIDIQC